MSSESTSEASSDPLPDPSTDPSSSSPARATKALVAVGTLVVLGAIAWGSMAFIGDDDSGEPLPAATGRPLTPWRPTAPAQVSGTPAASDPAAADRPVVLFDGPLAIDSGLGIDLDKASASPSSAKTDALDVYWAQKSGLSVNDGNLYVDQGLPAGAAERCAARVAADQEGYPALVVFPGDQFCLSTSDGRIAWLRVGEGADKDDELAMQATVWDGVPG